MTKQRPSIIYINNEEQCSWWQWQHSLKTCILRLTQRVFEISHHLSTVAKTWWGASAGAPSAHNKLVHMNWMRPRVKYEKHENHCTKFPEHVHFVIIFCFRCHCGLFLHECHCVHMSACVGGWKHEMVTMWEKRHVPRGCMQQQHCH